MVSAEHSIAAYWSDGMNEAGLADWARRLRARLNGQDAAAAATRKRPD